MKDISKLDDLELASYIKQVEDIVTDKRLQALITIDPSHEITINVKTLEYRLKEERLMRSIIDLQEKWNTALDDIKFAPLEPEEMEIAFPELKKYLDTKAKAEADELAAAQKAEAAKAQQKPTK